MLHDGQFSHVRFPSEWGTPQFYLGQSVCLYDRTNPALVTGVEWIALGSYRHAEGVEPGWHYTLALEPTAARYRSEPDCIVHESVIQPRHTETRVYHALAVAV